MNEDSYKKMQELFDNFIEMLEANNLELNEDGDIVDKDSKKIVLIGGDNE